MAISQQIEILEHNLFVTLDSRDPLGLWTIRVQVTGDASGGSVKVAFLAAQTNRVYVCHGVTLSGQGSTANAIGKLRLLTNFPPATPAGGNEGFSFNRAFTITREPLLTEPEDNIGATSNSMMIGTDKILLFGPIPSDSGPVGIVELETQDNTLNAAYFFEGWGYYWDKVAVLNAPGGPRFPGSS